MLDQADEKKSMEPDPKEDPSCVASADQPASSPLAELPIACALSDAELRERRSTLLDRVRRAAVQVAELPSGYAYLFDPASEIMFDLCRLIDVERDCCPFLIFTLIVSAESQRMRLEITGAPRAKAVIADFFGS